MLLYLYQIFIFLLSHIHFFLAFFLRIYGEPFKETPYTRCFETSPTMWRMDWRAQKRMKGRTLMRKWKPLVLRGVHSRDLYYGARVEVTQLNLFPDNSVVESGGPIGGGESRQFRRIQFFSQHSEKIRSRAALVSEWVTPVCRRRGQEGQRPSVRPSVCSSVRLFVRSSVHQSSPLPLSL